MGLIDPDEYWFSPICKLVNAQQQYSSNAAASATRVVVGATACAMHDLDEIRVHEIGDGSPWLAD